MKIKLLLCCVAFLLTSSSAFADTFNFSFSGNEFSGSGQFTATQQGSTGQYTISGVTGTVIERSSGPAIGAGGTESISSLLASGAYGSNDNLLFFPISTNSNKPFDGKGVAFTLADGSKVRLYNSNNEVLLESASNGGSSYSENGTITVSLAPAATPEPSSLALLGTGLLGMAGVIRKRLA